MARRRNPSDIENRLTNKVIVITGAANGIGLATTHLFLTEGATVIGVDFDEESLRDAVSATNANVVVAHVDVTVEEEVRKLVTRIKGEFGRIDALVHYAGINRDALSWKMNLEDFELVIKVNLTGSFIVARAVAEVMRPQQSGSIVLTSSRVYLGNIGQANYAASKGGVVSLTRTLALEYSRSNVRVNALAPGFIETRMTQKIPEHLRTKAIEAIPLQRAGHPEEVAKVALFLVSDDASYITGQVLVVDGGRTIGSSLI